MEKVLIAVNESRGSRAVIPAFRDLRHKPRTVVLVTVRQLPGNSPEDSEHEEIPDSKADRILSRYAWELENDGVIVNKVVRDGAPAEEILKVARDEGVDLIIAGRSCKRFFSRLLKRSVIRQLRKNGQIPVLVARDETCEEQSPGRRTRERVNGRELQPVPIRIRY